MSERPVQTLIPGTTAPPRKEPPCDGTRGDGTPCRQRGKHEHNGKLLCGAHYRPIADAIEQKPYDLDAYYHYQLKAFGADLFTTDDLSLHNRRLALSSISGSMFDVHYVRLRAERDAVDAEIRRRSAVKRS